MNPNIATSPYAVAPDADATGTASTPSIGLRARLTRWFDAVSAAQQRRADRIVRPYLCRQSDHTLQDLGFTPEQITALRREDGRVSWY